MNNFLKMSLVVMLLLFWASMALSQEVTGVTYAVKTTFRGNADSLKMNIWRPTTGNGPHKLIVWVHGGAFYTGNYRDLDSTCKQYAKLGYVAATVKYRLGFYGPLLLEPPFAYDEPEVVRACWRAAQDLRSALEYLVDNASNFSIDTSCIALAGQSAGSITVMEAVVTDAQDSIPKETLALDDVVLGFDRFKRPALGPISTANRPLPTIKAVINHFGGLMHPYMLDVDRFPPLFSYHQRGDLLVNCEVARGLWGLPFDVSRTFPVLYGSCRLDRLLGEGGHPSELRETFFIDGLGHELHAPQLVREREIAFLEKHLCSAPTSVPTQETLGDNSSWRVVDVLGHVLQTGNGGERQARRWVLEHVSGPVLVVVGARVLKIWSVER